MCDALEKLRCAERELNYRRRVYPRLIRAKRMSAPVADYEIKTMGQIVDDYRARVEDERPDLFGR